MRIAGGVKMGVFMDVPGNGRSFIRLFRGTYKTVAEQIDEAKMKRPGSSETLSLIYNSWKNEREKYEAEIIKTLNRRFLFEFTGELYLPKSNEEINNGVILDLDSQNLKFENERFGKLIMNKTSLINRLRNNDSLVKFIPFGYSIGVQAPEELKKNKYIIGRYGEEGAEKIAEICLKYPYKSYIFSHKSVNKETIRASVIGGWLCFGRELFIDGDFYFRFCGKGTGYAFGLC